MKLLKSYRRLISGLVLVSLSAVAGQVNGQTSETDQLSVTLQKAYEREFAFLAAQEKILNERLLKMDEKFAHDHALASSEVNRLEEELLVKRAGNDRLDNLLRETERTLLSRESDKEFFNNTIMQAENALKKNQLDVLESADFSKADDEQKLVTIFDSAASLLTKLSSVTSSQGDFFLPDGTKVSGDIVKVGNIAAYGLSAGNEGMLAPAGDNQYKLWPVAATESATGLESGNLPENLQLFLFESMAKDITPPVEKNAVEVVQSGGPIAWAIVVLGLLAVILCLVRIVLLKTASKTTHQLTSDVSELIRQGKVDEAANLSKEKSGSIGRVVSSTIRNLDRSRDHLEDIISESILHETPTLDRFGNFILVIAAVSPLVGLLGTVTGMIATFDVITEFGTGDPKLLSGGISVALVTTELGLIVAIPVLLIGNLLKGWSERIKHDMERSALRITNVYEDYRSSHGHAA